MYAVRVPASIYDFVCGLLSLFGVTARQIHRGILFGQGKGESMSNTRVGTRDDSNFAREVDRVESDSR